MGLNVFALVETSVGWMVVGEVPPSEDLPWVGEDEKEEEDK